MVSFVYLSQYRLYYIPNKFQIRPTYMYIIIISFLEHWVSVYNSVKRSNERCTIHIVLAGIPNRIPNN